MTTVRPIHRSGSRWYVSDSTHVRVPGVTSITGMLPKPFLTPWAAKLAAETAVDNLSAVESIASGDRTGAVDYVKNAHTRYTKSRAEAGSRAHDYFERLMRGEHVGSVELDMQPLVAYFREFLETVNPELIRAEDTVWSTTHAYAGSFDAILRIWVSEERVPTPDRSGEPLDILVDYKTSKDAYPDVALQLAAYANAETLIDSEGTESPIPALSGAAVLHITSRQWQFKPVRYDQEVFDMFLSLRQIFEWETSLSHDVLGKPLTRGGAMQTGTQRRK